MGSVVIIGSDFLLTIAGLSLAGWAGCVWLGRRGRAVAIAVGSLATFLTVATAADLVNTYYGYLPRVDDLVGVKTWPTASLREVDTARAVRPHRRGSVVTIPVSGTRSGFGTHA